MSVIKSMYSIFITLSAYGYRNSNHDNNVLFIVIVLLIIFGIGGVVIYILYLTFRPKEKIASKSNENDLRLERNDYFNIQLNNIKKQIYESINIIQNTSNPETYFERGRFAYNRINDLCNIEDEMNVDHSESQSLNDYFTKNFDRLIKNCYDEYVKKANLELKTQSGINKRISKFWFIAGKYLKPEEIEKIKTQVGCTLQDDDDYLINTNDWLDFEEKNRIVIEKHINKFEQPIQLAYQQEDIDKKIEFLNKAIDEYEKQKEWFYKSTGGRKYFKLYFENLHNSQCANFEYIDQTKNTLNYYQDCQEIVIPKIMELASTPEGILQKDMYVHFDYDKSEIREMVKYLEKKGKISKVKKGNSYLITVQS